MPESQCGIILSNAQLHVSLEIVKAEGGSPLAPTFHPLRFRLAPRALGERIRNNERPAQQLIICAFVQLAWWLPLARQGRSTKSAVPAVLTERLPQGAMFETAQSVSPCDKPALGRGEVTSCSVVSRPKVGICEKKRWSGGMTPREEGVGHL